MRKTMIIVGVVTEEGEEEVVVAEVVVLAEEIEDIAEAEVTGEGTVVIEEVIEGEETESMMIEGTIESTMTGVTDLVGDTEDVVTMDREEEVVTEVVEDQRVGEEDPEGVKMGIVIKYQIGHHRL